MLDKLRKNSKVLITVVAALAAMLVLATAGCSSKKTESSDNQGGTTESGKKELSADLSGSGSTFVEPLFGKMFEEYSKENSGVRVNYQGVGSGTGIKQLSDQLTDFGATDAPMKDEELAAAKGGEILHIPVTMGAVVVAYNVPGVDKGLKLSSEVVTDIFLGKITKWNDERIAADNPDVKLPDLAITVAHRSDGSGTTATFTGYLSAVSSEWESKVGKGKEVDWPAGVGAKGNSGVAASIQQTSGTVGYVELAYASQNNISYATIKNKAGKWVEPSLESVSAAADGATIPDDMRFSLVNADGDESYPIAGVTWAILYKKQTDKGKGEALVDLLRWVVGEGQKLSEPDYAKLPDSLVERINKKLDSVTF